MSKKRLIILSAAAFIVLIAAAVLIIFNITDIIRPDEDGWKENVFPDSVYDYWDGQSVPGSTCTHDDTYTEPVIPDGKYYPNGDPNATYYIEITDGSYVDYKNADGTSMESFQWSGQEFRVITFHYDDTVYLSYEWSESDPALVTDVYPNYVQRYNNIYGSEVIFEDDCVKIHPWPSEADVTSTSSDGSPIYCILYTGE